MNEKNLICSGTYNIRYRHFHICYSSKNKEWFLLDHHQPDPFFPLIELRLHRRKNGEKTHRTQKMEIHYFY